MLDILAFPSPSEARQAIPLPPRKSRAYRPMECVNRMLLATSEEEILDIAREYETRGSVVTPPSVDE